MHDGLSDNHSHRKRIRLAVHFMKWHTFDSTANIDRLDIMSTARSYSFGLSYTRHSLGSAQSTL